MVRFVSSLVAVLVLLPVLVISQTVNYYDLTKNNTSAIGSAYGTYSPTNPKPGNVSTQDMRPLLYSSANTKIYAHIMGWFCTSGTGNKCAGHVKVGYDSNVLATTRSQVTNLKGRQFTGMILDWYGDRTGSDDPSHVRTNQAATLLKQAALENPGFEFGIMFDEGALQACSLAWQNCDCLDGDPNNCTLTTQVIHDLNYAYRTFHQNVASSLKVAGRPAHLLFDKGAGWFTQVDWNYVRSHLEGNPVLMYNNWGGVNEPQSNGAYAWICPLPSGSCPNDPTSIAYLDDFYWNVFNNAAFSGKYEMGSAFYGFDDALAGWSQGRTVQDQCGETWLDSLGDAGSWYSSSHQLPRLQVVTWNDYDEGSAIEPGISNCIGNVPLTMSGTTVNWRVDFTDSQDHERTIKQYEVYSSTDGGNLTLIWTEPYGTGVHSRNVGTLNSRTQLFVRALGKSNIQNFMATPVCYNPSQCVQVSITGPADYFVGTSPVRITASAAAQFSPVTSMQVYLDGGSNAVYSASADNFVADIPMAAGQAHYVAIKAWTASGDSFVRYRHVYVK